MDENLINNELLKYIKENNVCFDDAQQMLKLCIYADSLLK